MHVESNTYKPQIFLTIYSIYVHSKIKINVLVIFAVIYFVTT